MECNSFNALKLDLFIIDLLKAIAILKFLIDL